jgi:5-methylcytosine-specific restriction endonuclease McrA
MKDRQIIFDKYGGKCAYCGCELCKGWHVDEIEPIRRNKKRVNGKWVANGCDHPERLNIENQNPACPSCNINKHSMSLEEFRQAVAQYVQSLNLYSTQYKIAKRYGLIAETDNKVVFYFESINNQK